MIDSVFIDSNIWLYALIEEEEQSFKHKLAKNLIANHRNIHVSTQVVNEVCINLIRKAKKDNTYILQFAHSFIASYAVHQQSTDDLLTAATMRIDYLFSYWDSLIVASAINNGCKVVYSEDMQDGLKVYDKLQIKNPLTGS